MTDLNKNSYKTIEVDTEYRRLDSNDDFEHSADKMVVETREDGTIKQIADYSPENNPSYSMDVFAPKPLKEYIGQPFDKLLSDIKQKMQKEDKNGIEHDWDYQTTVSAHDATHADFVRAKSAIATIKQRNEQHKNDRMHPDLLEEKSKELQHAITKTKRGRNYRHASPEEKRNLVDVAKTTAYKKVLERKQNS